VDGYLQSEILEARDDLAEAGEEAVQIKRDDKEDRTENF
jgi:hypothetical protein